MANVYAVKTGNWSDTTVWNTGALPTSADDVYSNTFTVTIDVSPTVLSINNGAASGILAGGQFIISTNGITLTATARGSSASQPVLAINVSSGNVANFIGNAIASTINNSGTTAIGHLGTGTFNFTGTATGGITSGGTQYAIYNNSTGTINITGNVIGGTVSTSQGVSNNSTGTINITGTVSGASSGGSGHGVINSSTGTINHIGTAQASASASAFATGAVGQVTTLTGPLISSSTSEGSAAASGVNPCIAARWFPADTALSTFTYTMRGATVGGTPTSRPARDLALPEATANAYPSTSNVRSGTVYGVSNAYTGTCAVPPAGSVTLGVPVDNTTGTAYNSVSDITNALSAASAITLSQQINTLSVSGSIGERLKTVSTVGTTAQQISDALNAE